MAPTLLGFLNACSGILGCDVYNAVFKMLPADAISFLLKTRQPVQI
jgi:hypothetical protein